jgi:hypothetical protein
MRLLNILALVPLAVGFAAVLARLGNQRARVEARQHRRGPSL